MNAYLMLGIHGLLIALALFCAYKATSHAKDAKRHAEEAVYWANEAQRLLDEKRPA